MISNSFQKPLETDFGPILGFQKPLETDFEPILGPKSGPEPIQDAIESKAEVEVDGA